VIAFAEDWQGYGRVLLVGRDVNAKGGLALDG